MYKKELSEIQVINFKHKIMSIKPICDKCNKELTKFGAILFSPPDQKSNVKKYHICVKCFKEIIKAFK